MEIYHQSQWIILFFLYSVAGWIWECFYVSMRKRRWVNRGFLHGPWLPIYGSGAILVLFLTLPVREEPVLVFLLGMIGATALEYVTGAVMERLFQMRYWDYSNNPLNVNGYICLPVSLAWGAFSAALIYVVHPPVERLLLKIPLLAADVFSLGLAVVFTVDVTRTVQTALDLRALMENLTSSSQRMAGIEERLKSLVEQLNESSEIFRQKLQQLEDAAMLDLEQRLEAREQARETRRELLLYRLDERWDKKSLVLNRLSEKNRAALDYVHHRLEQVMPDAERLRLENARESLLNLQKLIRNAENELSARKDRDFVRALKLLARNPSASSRKYREALEELVALWQENKEKKQK